MTPCARCAFANPTEARFCGSCGEPIHAEGSGPRSSRVAAEPTTLREPARESPEELGRLDLQRDMAAADAVRLLGLGRLVGALAREMARSAETPAIVNLSVARATALGRAKRAAESDAPIEDHPPKGIRPPMRDAFRGADAIAAEAKRDGLRVGQRDKEIADRAAPTGAVVSEMATALEHALDAGAPDWTLDRSLEALGKIAHSAESRGTAALRASSELEAELHELSGGVER